MAERPRGIWAAALASVVSLWACEPDSTPNPRRDGPAPSREAPAASTAAPGSESPADPEVEAIPVTLPSRRGGRGLSVEEVVGSGPGVGDSLPDCLSRCANAELSTDNRATCRLLCRSHYGSSEAPSDAADVDSYFGCFDQCEGDAACRQRCVASVAGDDRCGRRCLEQLGRCLGPCEAGGDAGTCAERCETTARACIGRC